MERRIIRAKNDSQGSSHSRALVGDGTLDPGSLSLASLTHNVLNDFRICPFSSLVAPLSNEESLDKVSEGKQVLTNLTQLVITAWSLPWGRIVKL